MAAWGNKETQEMVHLWEMGSRHLREETDHGHGEWGSNEVTITISTNFAVYAFLSIFWTLQLASCF